MKKVIITVIFSLFVLMPLVNSEPFFSFIEVERDETILSYGTDLKDIVIAVPLGTWDIEYAFIKNLTTENLTVHNFTWLNETVINSEIIGDLNVTGDINSGCYIYQNGTIECSNYFGAYDNASISKYINDTGVSWAAHSLLSNSSMYLVGGYIFGDTYIAGNFLPFQTLKYNLGSGAFRWDELYVSDINAETMSIYDIYALNLNVSNKCWLYQNGTFDCPTILVNGSAVSSDNASISQYINNTGVTYAAQLFGNYTNMSFWLNGYYADHFLYWNQTICMPDHITNNYTNQSYFLEGEPGSYYKDWNNLTDVPDQIQNNYTNRSYWIDCNDIKYATSNLCTIVDTIGDNASILLYVNNSGVLWANESLYWDGHTSDYYNTTAEISTAVNSTGVSYASQLFGNYTNMSFWLNGYYADHFLYWNQTIGMPDHITNNYTNQSYFLEGEPGSYYKDWNNLTNVPDQIQNNYTNRSYWIDCADIKYATSNLCTIVDTTGDNASINQYINDTGVSWANETFYVCNSTWCENVTGIVDAAASGGSASENGSIQWNASNFSGDVFFFNSDDYITYDDTAERYEVYINGNKVSYIESDGTIRGKRYRQDKSLGT